MEPASPPDVEKRLFLRRVAAAVLSRAIDDAKGIAANVAVQAQARAWLRSANPEPWCTLAKVRASRLRRRLETAIATEEREPKPRRTEPRKVEPPRDPLASLREKAHHLARAVGSELGAKDWIVSELVRSARMRRVSPETVHRIVEAALSSGEGQEEPRR